MNLRRFTIIAFLGIFLLTGCQLLSKKDKNAKKEERSRVNIENIDNELNKNSQSKINQISSLNYGVGYALEKEKDPSKNVQVAKDLNDRAISISGAPTLEEVKKMQRMIDDLTSDLAAEKDRGKKELENKDAQISELQQESKTLLEAKDTEIQKYMKIAKETAQKADAIQSELNKMDSFFGLGAVFYGLKHFVIRMAWILGIGTILYIVLRFAAMSNPIAASIFSIFDIIMSWFVQAIKLLAPKSVELAGHTVTSVSNTYRGVLVKLVDGIEALKEDQKKDPNKKYTLNEVLDEFSKLLDGSEKDLITKIKQDIGYK